MAKLKVILVILTLFLLCGNVVIAEESNSGTIEGVLINGTTGANIADQTVMILIVSAGMDVDTQTTVTSSEGKFIFNGLSTDQGYTYGIGVRYETVEYYAGPVNFASGETTKSVELKVFDTTDEDKDISITMSHAVISISNHELAVKEYHLFMNSGNTTFIGENTAKQNGAMETLKFHLPEGATNFESSYGLADYNILDGTEIIDNSPVVPGGNEISYTYSIPINSKSYTLKLKPNYFTTRFDLLITDSNIKVESNQLTESSPLNISNQTYRDFVGENVAEGEIIEVKLSSLGVNSTFTSSLLKWAWLILLPIAAVCFLILRRKKMSHVVVSADRDSLMQEIADLDDRFEREEIQKEEYLKERDAKKKKLLDVIKDKKE